MFPMPFSIALSFTALTFALGFGYIICLLSKKTTDKGLQGMGHIIGMLIMVLSTVLMLTNLVVSGAYAKARFLGSSADDCPMMKYHMKSRLPSPPMMK